MAVSVRFYEYQVRESINKYPIGKLAEVLYTLELSRNEISEPTGPLMIRRARKTYYKNSNAKYMFSIINKHSDFPAVWKDAFCRSFTFILTFFRFAIVIVCF